MIRWGAESRTTTVATTVNRVKMMRQMRSRTMAANFQSLVTSRSSSFFRILSVMNRISLRIKESSRWDPARHGCDGCDVSVIEFRSSNPIPTPALRKKPVPVLRSSSSSTFDIRLFDGCCCLFNSCNFLFIIIELIPNRRDESTVSYIYSYQSFRRIVEKQLSASRYNTVFTHSKVISFPGRCIRSIHGSHWRNTTFTCKVWYKICIVKVASHILRKTYPKNTNWCSIAWAVPLHAPHFLAIDAYTNS